MLYYPIQRYKFESNSQRELIDTYYPESCIIRYKDTNLKAIHNNFHLFQFFLMLYYPIQRYKFESNSQLCLGVLGHSSSCIIRYKDTNLKAIHNSFQHFNTLLKVVLSDTKIQI